MSVCYILMWFFCWDVCYGVMFVWWMWFWIVDVWVGWKWCWIWVCLGSSWGIWWCCVCVSGLYWWFWWYVWLWLVVVVWVCWWLVVLDCGRGCFCLCCVGCCVLWGSIGIGCLVCWWMGFGSWLSRLCICFWWCYCVWCVVVGIVCCWVLVFICCLVWSFWGFLVVCLVVVIDFFVCWFVSGVGFWFVVGICYMNWSVGWCCCCWLYMRLLGCLVVCWGWNGSGWVMCVWCWCVGWVFVWVGFRICVWLKVVNWVWMDCVLVVICYENGWLIVILCYSWWWVWIMYCVWLVMWCWGLFGGLVVVFFVSSCVWIVLVWGCWVVVWEDWKVVCWVGW